ncbi:TELO2-interacting protein 2-like [Periplaneta americana]|uniref:TELO2-interacting protein 2-like n=1 Tax=Periplaneta americana TaxID=6978 RepID=UPI0037E7F548
MDDSMVLEILELLKGRDHVPDVWQNVEHLISDAFAPQMTIGNERPCEITDFHDYLVNISSKLKNLTLIFKQISEKTDPSEIHSTSKSIGKHHAVLLLLLCGEHSNENIWTTSDTIKYSRELLSYLCKLYYLKSVLELLTGTESKSGFVELFSAAIFTLRPKLLKGTWKTYPAAVSCYQWMLFQMKSPHLSPHLNSVLPTALIILDDYVLENRISGIKCLAHITDNITRTELGWHGHGEVIYKALEPLLYQKKEALIQPLISCLVIVLCKIEGGYIKEEASFEWSRYDEVLEKVLQCMEMEDHCNVRLAYISSLPLLLDSAGLRMCRWSKRLLRVLSGSMEVAGLSLREEAFFALLALQVFLKHCWPFVPAHSHDLIHMLLKLLCDITFKKNNDNKKLDVEDEHIVSKIEECLSLVVKIAPKETQPIGSKLKDKARFSETFVTVVNRVFE